MMVILFLDPFSVAGQCKPAIKIDGKINVVDPNDKFGLPLPFWLKEGQTVAISSSVNSISLLEFSVNGTALEFSQVLNITSTSPQSVPSGKVWKLESVSKDNNSSTYQSATFGTGTFTWTVPACAEQICVEAWGGGGGGSGNYNTGSYATGSGGGGGGFGSQCFTVVPGTSYTVTVGDGGTGGTGGNPGSAGNAGGNSSVGSLITAYGGAGGTSNSSGGTGGTGGSSTSTSVAQGANGTSGASGCVAPYTGSGGAGGNGGAGAGPTTTTSAPGIAGTAPGGGGGGGMGCSGANVGGKGAAGKVIITW